MNLTFTNTKNKFGVASINDTGGGGDTNPQCTRGTGYYDPNGVFHCPSNEMPVCPSGQHPVGNYVGEYVCAPNTCPPNTTMGWNTAGTQVVCAPNSTGTIEQQPCPAGYHRIASGNCVRDVPVTNNPLPILSSGNSIVNYAKANPLIALAVVGGAYFVFFKKKK